MENTKNSYIKTDNGMVLNKKYIRWIKKIDECLEICIKSNGCIAKHNTHQICKSKNIDNYNKLIKLFE